ncbi:uncharacterized protein LOC126199030 [Schistocerca nitens]|uniref:uncharacterized protein LOC126199030 n=1 Tax=Schistocerca nitens TaxID=7011 RepID=UPI0021188B93|nr:uncharacterized protein LOC126199030 [Schistocerca nitens]
MAATRGPASLVAAVALLQAAAVCAHGRGLWQQAFAPVDALWPEYRRAPAAQRAPPEEPSSRDLTVGLAVGVGDTDGDGDGAASPGSAPDWPTRPYSGMTPDGATFRMRVAPSAEDAAAAYQWPALQVLPPVGPAWYQLAAPAAPTGLEPYQTYRWYRPPPPPPEEAVEASQVVGGRPLSLAGPYGDRRVGAFRLRADRGYQLTMDIPPAAPPGSRADGVLVMEMKANLYRPVV